MHNKERLAFFSGCEDKKNAKICSKGASFHFCLPAEIMG
jgi:hypothetical protein